MGLNETGACPPGGGTGDNQDENNLPVAELQGRRRQRTHPHRPTQRPMEVTLVKVVNYERPNCGLHRGRTQGAEVPGRFQIRYRNCQNVESIDRTEEPAL